MRLLTRARLKASRAPRAKRAADFDQAVAEFFMRIALDEAIELAKTFGSAESPAFVNGVLDAIWKKKDRETKRKKRKKAATE